MEQRLENMVGNWYGEIEDIYGELAKMGIDFDNATSEYIIAWYVDKEKDEDVELMIRLGGTQNTIVIKSIEETYRG